LADDLMAGVSDVCGGAFGVLPVRRRSGICEAQVPVIVATLEGFGGSDGSGLSGRPPLAAKRVQFARLIARGVGSAEACRIVGVHPKTGKRWRLGRVMTSSSGARLHYAAVVSTGKQVISERYLSEDERVRIADLRRSGSGVRAIAGQLGRSPSAVSRELRRNQDPGSGRYRPFAAQQRAARRRARPGRGKLLRDPVLREFIAGRLEKRWSPEQISHALRGEFPGDRGRHLAHETIYQAIYRPELLGLCRDLPRVLRTGRHHRKPHRLDGRRTGVLTGMINIKERPAEAAARAVAGHWEGDLIMGRDNKSAIETLVDRASRFTILLHVPGSRHTAEGVADSLVAALAQLPAQLRRSLTWDQGKEMALHADISRALCTPVFFCDPHSPWQRPTNENTNGLLRQYFPKGTDLAVHAPELLAAVAAQLNDGPARPSAGTPRRPGWP
jgi:transposase, IS30 family